MKRLSILFALCFLAVSCEDKCVCELHNYCQPPAGDALCGNGQLDDGEVCDGNLLNGRDCTALGEGYTGTLKCLADCSGYDETACVAPQMNKCGNGQLDAGEVCDGNLLNGFDCTALGEGYTGTLKCLSNCSGYDDTECIAPQINKCGNGQIDDGEVCDGDSLNGRDCSALGEGYTGTLKCLDNCSGYDETGCVAPQVPHCGNGQLDPDEVCDGDLLNGRDCTALGEGYTGTLACLGDCSGYDETGCIAPIPVTCGNGQLDDGEVCDGELTGGRNCASLGTGYTGMLKCLNDCSGYDESGCNEPQFLETCGNGQLDEGEVCDGELVLNDMKYDCHSIFGPGSTGKIKCAPGCLSFDKSECTPPVTCGDGSVQINEQCDPNYPNTSVSRCSAYYGEDFGGSRVCDKMCRWDVSPCIIPEHCGNGQLDEDLGEACDPSAPQSYKLTCEDLRGPGSAGFVYCNSLCKYSTSGCSIPPACGNGQADNGTNDRPNYHEACDPGDLKGKSCRSLGSGYSGTLNCLVNCSGFDFSGCLDP